MELSAQTILDEPLNQYGLTQVSGFIRDHDNMSTGKVTVIMQLENLPDMDTYDAIRDNGGRVDPYDLETKERKIQEKEEVDPVMEMMVTQPFFSLADATKLFVAADGVMLHVSVRNADGGFRIDMLMVDV